MSINKKVSISKKVSINNKNDNIINNNNDNEINKVVINEKSKKNQQLDICNPPNNLFTKSIFEQYLFFQQAAKQKWGTRALVFMQCGQFWETYGKQIVTEEETYWKGENIREMERMLNYESCSKENYEMTGIPYAALQKGIQSIVRNNYIFVRVDQEEIADAKSSEGKKRKYKTFYSKATMEDGKITFEDNKYIVQIYIEGYENIEDIIMRNYNPMIVGLSALDITTGESNVYEVTNYPYDIGYAIDEICRYLQTYMPIELYITTNKFRKAGLVEYTYGEIEAMFDLKRSSIVYNIKIMELENKSSTSQFIMNIINDINYQREVLKKVFPEEVSGDNGKILTPIQYIGLEKENTAVISYILLLQYIYESKPTMLNKLRKPTKWEANKYLQLCNNTIAQLNLTNTTTDINESSVFDIINKTSTSMGKRLLKDRLLNPIVNIEELNKRYDIIDNFINVEDNEKETNHKWKKVERILEKINDITRLHRQLQTEILSPMSSITLLNSYENILSLMDVVGEIIPCIDRNIYVNYIKSINEILDIAEAIKYKKITDINANIFKKGYDKILDETNEKIQLHKKYINGINNKLNELVRLTTVSTTSKKSKKTNNEIMNAEMNGELTDVIYDESLQCFLITQKKFEQLKKNLMTDNKFKIEEKVFEINVNKIIIIFESKSTSKTKFQIEGVNEISETLNNYIKILQEQSLSAYMKFLKMWNDKYTMLFDVISNYVAEVDVYKSCAKIAMVNKYCRPTIKIEENNIDEIRPFIGVKNMRHPIIEKINLVEPYHPHTLLIGKRTDNNSTIANGEGMLIYGLNSSGKSCLMKAVGINLIMAQAGMYVACDKMMYYPYKNILTRILGNDNMYKGLSSFAVEMSELRGILTRATQNSLVLGDEICHGTETISAVALVASAICKLIKVNSSFIFATHLHQLVELEEIKTLSTLGIYNILVEHDEINHKLKYDRNLKEGSGNPIYGIEVAKVMDLDIEVITMANKIRMKLMEENEYIVRMKKSNYNAMVYMDKCVECGEKYAEETHHVIPQKEADETMHVYNEMIKSKMHKNHMSNLKPLCKDCHKKETFAK